jgi:hypothetical protein
VPALVLFVTIETEGVFLPADQQTPDLVLKKWDGISVIENQIELKSGNGQAEKLLSKAMVHIKANA